MTTVMKAYTAPIAAPAAMAAITPASTLPVRSAVM